MVFFQNKIQLLDFQNLKITITMQKRFTQLLAIFFILMSQQIFAQDRQFSQFYASPMNLNPAMTGVFEGSFRAVINYREQYNSILDIHPFRTISAGFEKRFRIVNSDYLSVGVTAMQDQSGVAGYGQYRGSLSTSYMKQVGGSRYSSQSQYLIAGAQVGFGQNRIDPTRLWFSAQFDQPTVSVNNSIDNQEANLTTSTDVFLDFNAGLMWYARLDENKSVYIGGAVNHIAPAQITLYDQGPGETLHMRITGHAGAEIPLNRELSLLPAILVMSQGPSFQTNFGANFRYSNHDWREVAIRVGLWSRISKTVEGGHADALIISTILEMERINLGLSYDVNTSSLKTASQSRGSLEISLIYVHPTKTKYKVNCPKF
ncbi:MAG: type IX secretion system PorP/SprF family membrane protein [Granulosicoccus sp.]